MSGFSPYIRGIASKLRSWVPVLVLTVAALVTQRVDAGESVGCAKICVQLVQAIGDDIKEQIPLDCVQQTGECGGTGYFSTEQGRAPVVISGGLTGEILTLKIASGQDFFAPADQEALVMPLQLGNPYQAAQFVVGQRAANVPFANAGTALTVTVIAERHM